MSTSTQWTLEEDPSEQPGSDIEVSSEDTSSDSYPITPTTVISQPPSNPPAPELNLPRTSIRQTARISAPAPIPDFCHTVIINGIKL